MAVLGRKDRTKFRTKFIGPLLEAGWLAMTFPDKPTSSKQRYVTTPEGECALESADAAEES